MNKQKLPLFLIAFSFFFFIHIFLLNINVAEWGDSYRILRASEYIRDDFTYPTDEKRPPLYSAFLALRPETVDPVLWGRVLMLVVSCATFVLFSKSLKYFELNKKGEFFAYLLFILNPVYLYWSIRLYADVPFSFFVLLGFLIYKKFLDNKSLIYLLSLGFITGLGILTRFEGYLLFVALGFGLLINELPESNLFKPNFYIKQLKSNIVHFLTYVFVSLVTVLPYFMYRNPFTSTYFEETGRREYDLNTLLIYLVSASFLFGFTFACYFFYKYKDYLFVVLRKNTFITVFLILELLLVLAWPAAVPRLFVPIIPFLIILLGLGIQKYFEEDSSIQFKIKHLFKQKTHFVQILILFGLLGVYVISQVFLKLQFLVPVRNFFIVVVLIQVFIIYTIVFKKYKLFLYTLFFSLVTWAFISIWQHKDIFISVKQASSYISTNYCGTVAYNDVSSVSDWYLNQSPMSECTNGIYYDLTVKENRELDKINELGIDYALVTNEHNTDMEVDFGPWPHIVEIKEFTNFINGKEFFAKVIKINKEGYNN